MISDARKTFGMLRAHGLVEMSVGISPTIPPLSTKDMTFCKQLLLSADVGAVTTWYRTTAPDCATTSVVARNELATTSASRMIFVFMVRFGLPIRNMRDTRCGHLLSPI